MNIVQYPPSQSEALQPGIITKHAFEAEQFLNDEAEVGLVAFKDYILLVDDIVQMQFSPSTTATILSLAIPNVEIENEQTNP
ncbi:MAG: hypothetical protein M1814_001519 [Vezdaea aestivalis]|nr:MAG: hypothetical protein M1814_001519 [Vezdaea aestivalis]